MSEVDPVIFEFHARQSKFLADIRSTTKTVDRELGHQESRVRRLESEFKRSNGAIAKGFNLAKGAAVGFVASIGVQTITDLVNRSLQFAKSIETFAQISNSTTDEFQRAAFAAKSVGIEQEKLSDIFKDVNDKVGDFLATGGGELADFFEKIAPKVGVTAEEFRKLSGPQALQLYVSSLEKAGVSSQEMTFYLEAIANDASRLAPILANGGKEFNRLAAAADELGIVLSKEQIQKAGETAAKLDAVKAVLEARIAGVVTDNADSIIKLADSFERLIDQAGKAAIAYRKWRAGLDIRMSDNIINSWSPFVSDNEREQARQRRGAAQRELRSLTAPQRPRGGAGSVNTNLAGGTFRLAPNQLSQSLSGSPGRGAGLLALLGADPVAAVKAVNAMSAELQRLEADIAASRAELSGDLREQAAARKAQIDADLASTIERVNDEEGVTKETKAKKRALEEQRASLERQLVDQRLSEDLQSKALAEQERARRMREDQTALEVGGLDAEARLTSTREARQEIEKRILDLRQQAERDELEAAIAIGDIADAEAARAAIARKQAADAAAMQKQFLSPGNAYLERLRDDVTEFDDRVEEIGVRGLVRLNDQLTDTIANGLGLKGVLGDVVADFVRLAVQMAIVKPLAESIFGNGGGGSGGLGGFLGGLVQGIGAIFSGGRASGGYVNGGSLYRVNEGASPGRVEGFMPTGSGQIIPLGRMDALRSGGGSNGPQEVILKVQLSDDLNARIDQRSSNIVVAFERQVGEQRMRQTAAFTMNQVSRPRT